MDMKTVFNGTTKSDVPMCESFSNRKFKGHIDWRRAAEGGYHYFSNAP